MIYNQLTHLQICKDTQLGVEWLLTNNGDPGQTPQNTASDKGLYCLYKVQEFLYNMVMIKTTPTPRLLEIDLPEEVK